MLMSRSMVVVVARLVLVATVVLGGKARQAGLERAGLDQEAQDLFVALVLKDMYGVMNCLHAALVVILCMNGALLTNNGANTVCETQEAEVLLVAEVM